MGRKKKQETVHRTEDGKSVNDVVAMALSWFEERTLTSRHALRAKLESAYYDTAPSKNPTPEVLGGGLDVLREVLDYFNDREKRTSDKKRPWHPPPALAAWVREIVGQTNRAA